VFNKDRDSAKLITFKKVSYKVIFTYQLLVQETLFTWDVDCTNST
jgi:hypothetical protein